MRRWLPLLAAAAGIGLFLWLRSSPAPQAPQGEPPPQAVAPPAQLPGAPASPAPGSPAAAQPVEASPIAQSGPSPVPPPSLAGSAGQLQAPEAPSDIPPEIAVANMRRTVRQYHQMFGGNPIGTNPEITRALNGDNPRHVKFLQGDDGNRVNEKGELVDPWGTPYFFHQLSASDMEVRSAGPDKIMYTGDDLVTK